MFVPDPGVKIAPDPGSGPATLQNLHTLGSALILVGWSRVLIKESNNDPYAIIIEKVKNFHVLKCWILDPDQKGT
jgi:hypothetical protein